MTDFTLTRREVTRIISEAIYQAAQVAFTEPVTRHMATRIAGEYTALRAGDIEAPPQVAGRRVWISDDGDEITGRDDDGRWFTFDPAVRLSNSAIGRGRVAEVTVITDRTIIAVPVPLPARHRASVLS